MSDAGCLVGIGLLFGLIVVDCVWLVAHLSVPVEVAWILGLITGVGIGVLLGGNGE